MDGESPEEKAARTLSLWKQLDTQNEGSLDLKALKKGLKKLDHRELRRHRPELDLTLTCHCSYSLEACR